ncbi:MAG: RnfABCDGE type electron transport complex subunit B, partial [Buchnera aphidicola]|nr:RnfABCDGE type electron transport complex subunit B [Buchnera aphidicola]
DKFKLKKNPIIEKINECLPQSQCGQCGYSSCDLYSEAISNKSEKIDKCTPGGNEVILKLSNILNIDMPIKKTCKTDKNFLHTSVWIDEKNCVGCSKCAIFCPVDAIVGAP